MAARPSKAAPENEARRSVSPRPNPTHAQTAPAVRDVADSSADAVFRRALQSLGGASTLGKAPASRLEMHDLVVEGLPVGTVLALEATYPILKRARLSAMLGTSERTLQRKLAEVVDVPWPRAGSKATPRGRAKTAEVALGPSTSGSLWSVAELMAKAEEVFGGREIGMAWLGKLQAGLDGRVPIELWKAPPGARK